MLLLFNYTYLGNVYINLHVFLLVLTLQQSVAFNGNGYLELPSQLLHYENISREPALIALAIYTTSNGVLIHQTSTGPYGDFVNLRGKIF